MYKVKNAEATFVGLRLRRKWLELTILEHFFSCSVLFIFGLSGAVKVNDMHSTSNAMDVLLLYLFAYKGYGTKWLTFSIVAHIVAWALVFGFLFSVTSILSFAKEAPILVGVLVFLLSMDILWIILSLKLSTINTRLGFEWSSEAQIAKDILRSASNLEVLTAAFEQGRLVCPQYEPMLRTIYEERKTQMQASSMGKGMP